MVSNISHSLEYWKYVCHCELCMGLKISTFILKDLNSN